MRVLIIEDEEDIRNQVARELHKQGYVVDETGDGDEGLFFAQEYPIDLAVVDIGLPGMSGIDVIKKLRQQGYTIPVLILTARDRWQDKVEGLESGADDYLAKPFQMEELLARIKALLRRAGGQTNETIECGPIKLDFNSQHVSLNGQNVELTTFEYRLVEFLMRNANTVISKDKLNDYLYPHDEERDSNVIEVIMGRVRKKLDPDNTLKPIATLRGRGYRFTLCD
ncbi:MAG: response regulator transcription factor [Gammaproteobacteria bacterium]|nr:response regulator transcription factor [Gammaproteobacteria bacterium]MDH5650460.1 response regulator transcription factor [Gammaproteobacteria bacterium]